jgi:hypothetical protein
MNDVKMDNVTFPVSGREDWDVRFVRARFQSSVDISQAKFLGGVDFSDTIFVGDVKLDNVSFGVSEREGWDVSFIRSQFQSSVDFSQSVFWGTTSFGDARFGDGKTKNKGEDDRNSDEANFASVIFKANTSFVLEQDEGEVKISDDSKWSTFINAKPAPHTSGRGAGADFKYSAGFVGVTFQGYARFGAWRYKGNLDQYSRSDEITYDGVSFTDVDFTKSVFEGRSSWYGVTAETSALCYGMKLGVFEAISYMDGFPDEDYCPIAFEASKANRCYRWGEFTVGNDYNSTYCSSMLANAAWSGQETEKSLSVVPRSQREFHGVADIIKTFGSHCNKVSPGGLTNVCPSDDPILFTFQGENTVWRLLRVDNSQIFVMSEHILGAAAFNFNWVPTTWDGTQQNPETDQNYDPEQPAVVSDLHERMNHEIPYYSFIDALGVGEMASQHQFENGDNPEYQTDGGAVSADVAVALSIDEVHELILQEQYSDPDSDQDSWFLCWPRLHAGDTQWEDTYDFTDWWLRSPGSDPRRAAVVYDTIFFYEKGCANLSYGDSVSLPTGGVRPALWLHVES